MFKCRKCGTVLDENDKFCGYCGTKQESNKKEVVVDRVDEADRHKVNENKEDAYEVNVDKVNMNNVDMPIKNHEQAKPTNQSSEDSSNDGKKQIIESKKHIEDTQGIDYGQLKNHNIYTQDKLDEILKVKTKINPDINSKKPRKNKSFTPIIIFLFVLAFTGSYIFFSMSSTKNSSKTDDTSTTSINSNNSSKEKSSVPTTKSISQTNKVSKKTGGYILPNSDKEPLTSYDLKNMSKEQLALARNEIFARHGYKFGEPFKSYFQSKSWYSVNPNYTNDMKELSPLERHNAKTILIAEGKGENLDPNYDADYYENNYNGANNSESNNKDYHYIQSAIVGYLNNMAEAINSNDYSKVSPYIVPDSKLEMYQRKLIKNLNSQNIKEKWKNFRITNIQHIDNGLYKVSTHETYVIYSGGEERQKEFDYVYTVEGNGTTWGLSNIEN
ncbi:TcaA NTF2-like domain-containing protein [Clostridium sp. DJ247]|uniref:TcaA NTF2-like domain-containing protein n=1 Tax=Clostridium sp. DJ247 TaxID=2726188 RepID=UPI001629505B|nr:YARHG domain-containing protein [Clostridium sp. DJ247]MBC2582820.1 YARHG domain-containing protein [Clostridium sp. DJ247]